MSTPQGALPVLSIPVDTSGIDRFVEALGDFHREVNQATLGSQAIGRALSNQLNTFAQQVQMAHLQHQQQLQLLQVQHSMNLELMQQRGHVDHMQKAWKGIATTTKKIAGELWDITRGLLGFGAIGTAGTLLGLGALAGEASNLRRTSMGLGVTSGELGAFRTDFQRLLDPDQYLGWIGQQEQSYNQTAAYTLLGHGLTGNTARDAIELLEAVRRTTQGMPLQQLGYFNQMYGTDFNQEELRRIRDMSTGEFLQLIARFREDRTGLNVPDATLRQWQDFTRQMSLAGQTVKTTLMDALAPLAGPLADLSRGFAHLAAAFLRSPMVERGIKKLGDLLEQWSREINTPQFRQSLKDLVADFEWLASKIGPAIESVAADLPSLARVVHDVTHPASGAQDIADTLLDIPLTGSTREKRMGAVYSAIGQQVSAHKDFGQLQQLLEYVAWKESSYGQNQKAFEMGIGAFGLTAATTREAGFDPGKRNDISYAAGVSEALLAKYSREFGGDWQKTLAAYTSGETLVRADVAKYGASWRQHLTDPEFNRWPFAVNGVGLGRQAANYLVPSGGELEMHVMPNGEPVPPKQKPQPSAAAVHEWWNLPGTMTGNAQVPRFSVSVPPAQVNVTVNVNNSTGGSAHAVIAAAAR